MPPDQSDSKGQSRFDFTDGLLVEGGRLICKKCNAVVPAGQLACGCRLPRGGCRIPRGRNV
jgi:hypothetical protein